MATIEKSKSPAPPATAETTSDVKEKTPEVPSTVAPGEKSEVATHITDTKTDEPSKVTSSADDADTTKPSDDAEKPSTEKKPSEEPAPQSPQEQTTTQTTEPVPASEDQITAATTPLAETGRPSRAAAQKAQEASKANTLAKKKSSTNLAGAAASPAGKRKSFGGKAGPDMAIEPGMIVLARLKGYSPWPAIIVEEDMLPEKVLKVRPKDSTSKRKGKFSMSGVPEGEIPLAAQGSSAGHWPIMFLDNFDSFSWTMFTDIMPLDKTAIDAFSPRGKAKDIVRAYENAAKGLTLDEIRDIKAEAYADEEEEAAPDAMEVDEPEAEEEEEEVETKTPKGKKKAAAKETTSSKKRKAEEEIEDTSKTPKKANTGKNAKTPASAKTKTPANGASKRKAAPEEVASTSKSTSKKRGAPAATPEEEEVAEKSSKKKAKSTEKKAEKDESPDDATSSAAKVKNLTAEKDQKEKEVMYLRHRIQKALLTTQQVPTEQEVVNIDHYFQKLESYPKLEVAIIKKTKINKVLKALLRLASIPFDEKYKFKDRTLKMLDEWNQLLANDPETSGTEPNGVKKPVADGSQKKKTPDADDDKEKKTDSEKPEEKKNEQVEISGSSEKENKDEDEEKPEEKKTEAPAPAPAVEEKTETTDTAMTDAGKEVAAEA